MRDLRPYRILFLVAFLWNMAGGIVPLLDLESSFQLMYGVSVPVEQSLAYLGWEAFWVSVLLFGVGYLFLALNPLKNHGVVVLAIVGKSYIGLRWILMFLDGSATWFALLGGLGDVAFALVFVVALRALSREARQRASE